eukprot:sb/3464030/
MASDSQNLTTGSDPQNLTALPSYFQALSTLENDSKPLERGSHPVVGRWTPYELVRGDITTSQPLGEDLEAVSLYLIARQGSSNMGDQATGMQELAKRLAEDAPLPWLQDWHGASYKSDDNLVPEGMLELYHLAKRWKKVFPDLFPAYYPTLYNTLVTPGASQSASSFLFGLFEGEGPLSPISTIDNISWTGFQPFSIQDDEGILSIFEDCPAYTDQSELFEDAFERFHATAQYRLKLMVPLSKSLGFQVRGDDVLDLFSLCAFSLVSPSESSEARFCEFFTADMLEILNFILEQEQYFSTYSGNPIATELACVLVEDVVESLRSSDTPINLRFTHSILPLVDYLGLYEGVEEAWWNEEMGLMNLSTVEPFTANVAFLLLKNKTSGEETIKVFANEREVTLRGGGTTLSSLESLLNTCDREELCSPEVTEPPIDGGSVTDLIIADTVVLNSNVFLAMLVTCFIAVILSGVMCYNRKRLFSTEVVHRDFWDITTSHFGESEKMLK